ncbi:MAG: RdgB/HAM1 family non-canonical purine NTP pyrophosphatase [Actinobacteria bacterium]|nr:RdgB/HAM1 family non-canonical purine NTP pyrophosphatase [Actinomycetota bacterium]
MFEIVLGTANPGKVNEIVKLWSDLPVRFITKEQMEPWPDIVESGDTYLENALIKARALVEFSSKPVLADDSGIEIDALDGAPGVKSARFAGSGATDASNNLRMAHLLLDVPEGSRTARYRCVAVLVKPDGTCLDAEGVCEGSIALVPEGEGGFGYDPWFVPAGQDKTFGQLSAEFKDSISHRGEALRRLAEKLKSTDFLT